MRKTSYEALIFLLKKSQVCHRPTLETVRKPPRSSGPPGARRGGQLPFPGEDPGPPGGADPRSGREMPTASRNPVRADAGAGELTCRGRARVNTGDGDMCADGRESRACVTCTCPGQSSLVIRPVRLRLNYAVTPVSLQDR